MPTALRMGGTDIAGFSLIQPHSGFDLIPEQKFIWNWRGENSIGMGWDGCRWTDPIADIVCRMVNISILNIKLYGKIQKIIYGRKKYHITSKVPTNFFIALLIFSPFINISFSAFLSHITISLNHIWFGSLFHENEVIIKGIFKNITLILLGNLWILWLSQREGISRTTRWWAVLVFNCPDDNVATNSNSFIVANSFFCY